MTKFITSAILFLTALSGIGQINPKSITSEQASKDLEILETSLREIHPNIYRYTSKSDFNNAFTKAKNSIKKTIGIKEFYTLIAPIIAMVRCGHTFGVISFVNESRGLLPLEVKILDGKLYVFKNFSSEKELEPGSEILSINGLSSSDLINDFRAKSVADGYGLTFKDKTIEKYFRWKYATFINQPDSFRIECKDYLTKNKKAVTIQALSNESFKQRTAQAIGKAENPLSFLLDRKNDVAILKVGTFMTRNIKKQSGQNFKKTIRNSFKELKRNNISNLIIDVRNNTGGKSGAPPYLFSFLAGKDFKYKRKLIFRHGYKFNYSEYLNRNTFNDWINRKLDRKINDTTFEWTLHNNTRKIYKAKKSAFQGNLYVIINGMTASAGAEFVSLVSVYGKGVFIGEETGGDFNGVNGMDRTYLTLPNSKIGILIAGWRGIMAWDENKYIGHGVPPTFEIHPAIGDLLSGRDAELDFIYSLMRSKN